ncbi:hypothetical protein D5F01_LYC01262 [Larimichthys crocea]|uniref:CCHC-type domain-containing protein n=1 Tax=Larimichthys crocea TaxID=215358 RepID=A0A6G0JC31_LARCR|nr:hypothetical protein D5F01_LYC01262 [Larimichthys crocea]
MRALHLEEPDLKRSNRSHKSPKRMDRPGHDGSGKQLPSLESGGYRFGEELVSFCKNWSPTSHELRRLEEQTHKRPVPENRHDLDGDYHQEQSEWRAAGEYESVYHSVQSSCIGWKDQRLKEIRRHAKHAEERQTEERDKELEKRELTQYNASLTMMQSIVDQHAGRGPNRGRGGRGRGGKRGRGGGRGQTQEKNATHDQDECFYCKEKGHWARDCPKKKQ